MIDRCHQNPVHQRPIAGDGNSPVKIKWTAAPNDARPMRSAMSYPRTATAIWLNARHRSIPHRILIGFTHKALSFHLLKNFNHRTWQFTKCIDHGRAGLTQRFHFAGVRATSAFNNRACMTEARAFARRFAANICDHRFGNVSDRESAVPIPLPVTNQSRQKSRWPR